MSFKVSKTITEQIYGYLTEKIIHGSLAPGERVFEPQLAEELGVSRSPIREAFRMLEKSRLIEVKPQRGARVTEFTIDSVQWTMEVLEQLEVMMTRNAALHGSKEEHMSIRMAYKKLEHYAQINDFLSYQKGMMEFSKTMQRVLNNPVADDLIKDIDPNMTRMIMVATPYRRENLKQNARMVKTVVEHIEKREVEKADQATRKYTEYERNLLLKAFRKMSAEPADQTA